MINLRWKLANNPTVGGEVLYLGDICVGSVYYDGLASRHEPCRYIARCLLPGKFTTLTRQATITDAKHLLEKVVKLWLSKAGVS